MFGDFDHALVAGAVHREPHGRLTIEASELIGLREAVDNLRDVSQENPGSVGTRPQHQALVVVTAIGLPYRSQQDLAAFALHRATGQVERRAPHSLGHLIEGQSMPSEHALGHFNGDLVRAGVGHLNLCDLWNGCQIVSHAFSEQLECQLVCVPGHRQIDYLAATRQFSNNRLLRLIGKRVDRVDVALDLVNDPARISAKLEFDLHRAAALGRRGGHLLYAVDTLNGLLDPDRDRLLHFLWSRAKVVDLDRDHVEVELGHHLQLDRRDRQRAPGEDDEHHQVGCDSVSSEPVDGAIHDCPPSAASTGWPSDDGRSVRSGDDTGPAATCTRIPSVTTSS